MAYQDIPTGSTQGAGAGSGEVLVTATDTTGGFLNDSLTTTAADITKAVVNGGADETLNLSLPNLGPGAVTSGTAAAPIQTATTDARGRIVSFGTAVARDVPANWALTLVRYFLVDYDAGNDANVGYIDAAAGTVHSGAAVAAAAIKTFTKLMTIVPLLGNGRSMVVLVKNRAAGATYLDSDAVTESVVNWSGLSGYKLVLRRGSTDLTNSTTDRVLAGFITALAGPNGDGSFTCLAGGTTTVFSVTGTPFPAEPGILHYRVRFTGNVTAGLANVVVNITASTTSQITVGAAITAPAVGDTFLIEQPGVRVAQYADASNNDGEAAITSNTLNGVTDVGFTSVTDVARAMHFQGGTRTLAGIEASPAADATTAVLQMQSIDNLWWGNTYFDEAGVSRNVGFGGRTRCAATWNLLRQINQITMNCFGWCRTPGTGILIVQTVRCGFLFQQGSYVTGDVRLRACGSGGINASGNQALILGIGASTTLTKTRITSLSMDSCTIGLIGVECGTQTGPSIAISQSQGFTVSLDNITNAAGATVSRYMFEVTGNVAGCMFLVGRLAANTATGTLGDMAIQGAVVLSHAALLLTNVRDNAGNQWMGTAGEIVGPCILVTNSSGGALAVGEIVRKNATTTQVVTAQGDTAANAIYAGVMVTAPASAALGYMVTDGTPYTLFDGAPTLGNIAYLSPGTARKATTTVPAVAATNQKLRLGRVLTASGSTGRMLLQPEIIAVAADGLL